MKVVEIKNQMEGFNRLNGTNAMRNQCFSSYFIYFIYRS